MQLEVKPGPSVDELQAAAKARVISAADTALERLIVELQAARNSLDDAEVWETAEALRVSMRYARRAVDRALQAVGQ